MVLPRRSCAARSCGRGLVASIPGSPEFDKESVVYYDYDPDSAKALLAQIGLEDTDGNGFVNYTDGPLAGQDVILAMTANEDQREAVNIAEALVNQFAAVGIKVNYRTVTSATRSDMVQQGTWDMHVSRQGQVFALPFTRVVELAPITPQSPAWHREGDTPRQLQPFEQELIDIVLEYRDTYDAARRMELMFEYNKIFTENVYDIGVFIGRYGLGLAKRSRTSHPEPRPSCTPGLKMRFCWIRSGLQSISNYLKTALTPCLCIRKLISSLSGSWMKIHPTPLFSI